MLRWLPILAAAVTILLGGILQGRAMNRWGSPEELARAIERLEQLPMVIGGWHGQVQPGLDPREVSRAEIAGYLCRSYDNPRTNQRVRLLIACGRPGPISVHTPDVCFEGAGYAMLGSPTHYLAESKEGVSGQFWTAKFGMQDQTGSAYLRVCWAWSAQGPWQAPQNPRWQFGGRPALYKLYLIQEVLGRDENPSDDACRQFLAVLLPALQQSLFADDKRLRDEPT
jgi:hypothetical protein